LLCRHHIYELVLRSVFEEKFGSTSGPNIQLFKKFQDNWSKIDTVKFNPGIENDDVSLILCNDVQQRVLEFALTHSKEKQFKALYQDILFIQCLIEYENIDKQISNIAIKKFCGNLWYLNPEAAAFSFFDSNIPLSMKIKMVDSLKIEDGNENIKHYISPMNNLTLLKSSQISDFINSSSMKFFERFNIATDFLNQNPEEWYKNVNYQKGISVLSQVKVVNDAAERGVKLITDFNDKITKDEEQKQFLIQTVYDYRHKHPDAKRSTLSKHI